MKGAETYIRELIGDTLSMYYPERAESYTNRHLDWGKQTEAEARNWFALDQNTDVKQVGFITTDDGHFGCSPDGLLYDCDNPDADPYPVAGLELKCPSEKVHAGYLIDGPVIPSDYVPQVHGGMIVTGLPCWFFLSYCPGLPPLLVRIEPNDYTAALAEELERFHAKYQAALEKVRNFGAEAVPAKELELPT